MATMLLLYLFGVITLATTGGAQEYHGCYENLDFTKGIAREFKGFNLNADCAAFCASRGYILAATHHDQCHCTNHMPRPEHMIESPRDLQLEVRRFNNPCGIACPGALVTRSCRGDECCGGLSQDGKRYSLYAVGAIDPVHVYVRRIRKSLMERFHPWLGFHLRDERPTCFTNFIEVRSRHGYLQLDKERNGIEGYSTTDANDLDACLVKCRRFNQWSCQAINYFPQEHKCVLIAMSSLTANLTLSKRETQFYDRNCTSRVQVLSSSLQLDPVRQTVSDDNRPGGSLQQVLDTEDVELDLTESGSWEKTENSVTFSTSQDYSTSTHSGFTKSRTSSRGEESTESRTDERETSQGSTTGVDGSIGISVGASASANFWVFSASIETEFTVDTTFSEQSSKDSRKSSSDTSSNSQGSSTSETESESFNYGYENSRSRTHTQSYSYSMTVPAQHKGVMTFFIKKKMLIRKVVTDLQLNGFLKMRIRGDRSEEDEIRLVHVARVLSPRERRLSVLTENIYQRQVFLAKITITDPEGNMVTEEKQLLDQ